MPDFANLLFELASNITVLNNKEMVISHFLEGINSIFSGYNFAWKENAPVNTKKFVVATEKQTYGFIASQNRKSFEIASESLIGNACRILALKLENLGQDILVPFKSEAQKPEEVLQQAAARFETLIQVSPLAIILVDTEGNVQLWNKAAEQIFGWSTVEILGNPLPIIPEIEKEGFRDLSAVVLSGVVLINQEVVRKCKDGRLINVNVSSAPVFDSGKNIIARMAIIADVTEKKQIEKELIEAKEKAQENEAWLRSIFASANIGIAVTDARGRWVNWNKTTNRLFGLSDEEMRHLSNIDITHPDDIELTKEKIAQVVSGQIDSYRIEKRYLKKDNSFWWADLSVSPIKRNGKVVAFVGIASDITAKKNYELDLIKSKEETEKSEEKYRLLLENMNDLVCEIDQDGVYTYLNNKYIDVLGYHPDELLGRKAIELIHPEDLLASLEKYKKLTSEKGDSVDVWRFLHKNGSYRMVESKGKVFVNSKAVLSTVVISRDITRQYETEQEIIRAKEKAEESDRLKTAFLQNMSHEIRTPMNAIIGFSEILLSKYDDKAKLKKYTGFISQRSNDLLDIINDLLDIAKIESGQLSVNLETCSLTALFEELTTFFIGYQKRIGKEHISLDIELAAVKGDVVIETDALKLKQILINLLTNAFKFTEEGSVSVGFSLESDKRIRFYVSDTGIGIPEEKQSLIFERFSQLEQYKKKNIGGTGLGLSIVKGFVKLLEGEINLESEAGKGSVFSFSIPVKVHQEKNNPGKL